MLFKLLSYLLFFPLMTLLRVLLFWLPPVQTRARFEKKNKSDPLSVSFKQTNKKADMAFEFSSEGEYQQVASLIQDSLLEGKKLELIFFSPSVEKAVMDLGSRYPSQIRYLRYPILGWGFSSWLTSQELILVRYDLFPEFLAWVNDQHKLKMVWMSFKKDRIRGRAPSFGKRLFLKSSSQIFYASREDQKLGEKLGYPGALYDFRLEQIARRINLKEQKFQDVFPQYQELKALWESFPMQKRLIIGNAWPSDLEIIKNIPSDIFVMIVPHKLDAPILKAFRDALFDMGRAAVEINTDSKLLSGRTFILNKKGVLCELYSDFGMAYVGGGFETSIHSVLEPLVAGSQRIACGPLHHRSTEFDLAQDLGNMTELKSANEFDHWLQSSPSGLKDKSELQKLIAKYPEFRREVLSC